MLKKLATLTNLDRGGAPQPAQSSGNGDPNVNSRILGQSHGTSGTGIANRPNSPSGISPLGTSPNAQDISRALPRTSSSSPHSLSRPPSSSSLPGQSIKSWKENSDSRSRSNDSQHAASIRNSSVKGLEQASSTANPQPLEADTPFDDDLLLGDDLELALMDDFDNPKGGNGELTLSWPETPPKRQDHPTLTRTHISPPAPHSIPNANIGAVPTTPISRVPAATNYSTHTNRAGATISRNGSVATSGHRASATNLTAQVMTPIPPASLRESSTYPRNIVDSGVIQPAQTSSSGSRALFPRELTRPDELDTVDMRHQQRVQREQTTIHDEIGQDEHALQRTRSSSSDIPSAQRSLRKRRLPGPAGNLPRLSAEEKEHLFRSRGVPFGRDSAAGNTEISNPTSSIKRKMKSTVDGPMDSMFANGAWDEMLKVYRLPDYRPSTYSMFKGRASLIEVSLSDIEKRQQQYPGKIRHLVVMIKEFTSTEMDGSVIVLDPSGEMPGTVHRSVLDYFKNNEIRIGTVLVLDNVSVFSPTLVSHYLIITLRNIKGIFQPHPPTILLSQGSSPRSISSQDRLSQRQQHQLGSPSGPGAHPNTGSNAGPHAMTSPSFVSPERIQPAHGMIRRRRSPSPNWPSDLDPSPKSIGGKSNISSHQPTGPNPGNEPQQESQENKSSKASASSKRQKPDSSSVIISPILAKDSQESKDGSEHLSPVTEETLEAPTFQSLRQTFGSSMPLSERNRNSESDMWDMGHLGVTPVIPLGDPTPKLSSQTSILLSSFAAPASIRKRSTSSTTSQRSSSSISAAGSVAAPDTNSRAGPKTTMRGAIPIISKTVNPRGSATETSMTTTTPLPPALMATPGANPAVIPKPRKSLSSELLSSADWLDDISEVDFESGFEETQPLQGYQNGTHNGVSGKDMPSGIYSGHGNGGSRGTGDSRSNARQLPQPVTPASKIENSAATSSAVSTDSVHYPSRGLPPVEEAEDDLDFLLDGLDESELYDI